MAKAPMPSPDFSPKNFSTSHLSDKEITVYPYKELQTYPLTSQKAVAEFLGTFILIFIGCGSAFINQISKITLVGVAMVWGIVVTAMIYTLGHISGAHLNPAVTIAFATAGRFPWKHVPIYVVVQVVGAILASISLCGLFGEDHAEVMLTLPVDWKNDLKVIAWEFIISFNLMFVICGAASDHRAVKDLAGVAIGATIFFNVVIAGNITGASMNPARSIGPAVATHKFDKLWIYIVAPVIGTVVASTLYRLLRAPEEPQKTVVSDFTQFSNKLYPNRSEKSMELP